MSETKTGEDLKDRVREHYAERAKAAAKSQPCSCCGGEVAPQDELARGLYAVDEVGSLPERAVLASLGCGNPTALADLRPGEVVLDLGSGGGIDVLLSARRVGADRQGLWPGHDRRDARAGAGEPAQGRGGERRVPQGRDRGHARFRTRSVDVIISNCVINLSPDKDKVLRRSVPRSQAGRSLRCFGRRLPRRPKPHSREPEGRHRCLGRLRRRRSGRAGLPGQAAAGRLRRSVDRGDPGLRGGAGGLVLWGAGAPGRFACGERLRACNQAGCVERPLPRAIGSTM